MVTYLEREDMYLNFSTLVSSVCVQMGIRIVYYYFRSLNIKAVLHGWTYNVREGVVMKLAKEVKNKTNLQIFDNCA
jgi:nitrite reductase/ring-hydroxylating ferredoxin subunit